MACPVRHGSTQTYILKSPSSNLSQDTAILTQVCKFSQYLQETAGILMNSGYERQLLQSFKFIGGIIIVTQWNVRKIV